MRVINYLEPDAQLKRQLHSMRFQQAAVTDQTQTGGGTSEQTGVGTTGTNYTQQAATGTTGQQATANVYNPQSAALQTSLPQQLQAFLQTGNLPGNFAAPSQVTQAYNTNFQSQIAPQLAAQYGAGSPQIAGQQALGLQQLLSNLYQTQSNNLNNVLGTGTNLAYSTTGQLANQLSNQLNTQAGAQTQNTANTQNTTDFQTLNNNTQATSPY